MAFQEGHDSQKICLRFSTTTERACWAAFSNPGLVLIGGSWNESCIPNRTFKEQPQHLRFSCRYLLLEVTDSAKRFLMDKVHIVVGC
eukprot:4088316-Amphidinium_carterae.1